MSPAPSPLVHLVAGARPNFMKVAPLHRALTSVRWCRPVLVHTQQHYDELLSDQVLRDLGMPTPDVNLGVGSGSHAVQTARVMTAYEQECLRARPDLTIVVGDVNSTLACALTAAKLGIRVAHLEAGLRSRDRTMPEEVNRLVADAMAVIHWTPSDDATENLLAEGFGPDTIEMVGNIMIDSLELFRSQIEARGAAERLGLPSGFGLVTLHRPSNVDDPTVLAQLVRSLRDAARIVPVAFPVHPRTEIRLADAGLLDGLRATPNVSLLPPLGYLDFLSLVMECSVVITDSGGLQEETTYLGVPCLTVRNTTERPITVTLGTNRLIAPDQIPAALSEALSAGRRDPRPPRYWDGGTAQRVVDSLARHLGGTELVAVSG